MNSVVVKQRICTSPVHSFPPAADRSYKVKEEVLVYSENKKERIGSLRVVSTQSSTVMVRSLDGNRLQIFNTFQLMTVLQDCFYNLK